MEVARVFGCLGYEIHVPKIRVRPDSAQRMDYSDDGDIKLIEVIEVKRRKMQFSSIEDFKYPTIIVDVCHTFDNREYKPRCYVIVNEPMTGAIIINVHKTRKHWRKRTKTDNHAGREREFYECPIHLCSYMPFPPKPTTECPF